MNVRKEQSERTLSTTVTYLATSSRAPHVPPPLKGCAIFRAEDPPPHFYLYLYNEVGREFFWLERRLMTEIELASYLASDRTAIYVLYVNGVPAGFAGLDFRPDDAAWLVYFGLLPEFRGRQLG